MTAAATAGPAVAATGYDLDALADDQAAVITGPAPGALVADDVSFLAAQSRRQEMTKFPAFNPRQRPASPGPSARW